MAKLSLLVALAFAAILVVFSDVSAYKTTIITTTTTSNDDFPWMIPTPEDQPQCQRHIPAQQVNYCQMHLTQGVISSLKMVVENRRPPSKQQQPKQLRQQCCKQLNSVERECQCNAIQTAFDEARVQGDVIQSRLMLSKAYKLVDDCNLQVQDCSIASPRI